MSSLARLFDRLDDLEGRAPLDQLTAILEECEIDCDDVTEHIGFSERCYQRAPIRGNEHFQAWVMCWLNGQRSPIHDHRGSSCGVRVLEGTLTETLFEVAPNGHIKPTLSRDLEPGGICAGEDSDIHQVSNLQAEDAKLITLHVYSPPLIYMGTYDLSSALRKLEPLEMALMDAAGI